MLDSLQARLQAFASSRWSVVLRIAFLLAVGAWLIHRIGQIGWRDLLDQMPTNPWFYILFLAIYLLVPLSEIPIYRMIWQRPMVRHFPYLLRKNMYNVALVGYSGEAFFVWFARHSLHIPGKQAFSAIKTNNVLSALGSNLATIVLLVLFMMTGNLALLTAGEGQMVWYVGASVVITLVLSVLIYHFRHTILDFPAALSLKVFGIHAGRNGLLLILQALQWAVIIPSAPISVWILFLTAQFLLTRIPFLPNKDLVFLGLTLSLTGIVHAPEALVASMFLTSGALIQIANLVVFGATSIPGVIAPHRPLDEHGNEKPREQAK